jgi:hypothetical protein
MGKKVRLRSGLYVAMKGAICNGRFKWGGRKDEKRREENKK